MIRLKNLKKFNYFHVLSRESAKALINLGVRKKSVCVLSNGIKSPIKMRFKDLHFIKGKLLESLKLDLSTKIVVTIGSIEPRKGIHVLQKALNYLPSDIHVLLIGKPPAITGKMFLKRILLQNGSKRIHYIGHQSKKTTRKIIACADCFVSSSLSEACQLSPLEAANLGIPVIISDVGASRDIFGKQYKYLVKPNSPKELSSKIYQALNESSPENQLFNVPHWNKIGKKMLQLYLRIIKE